MRSIQITENRSAAGSATPLKALSADLGRRISLDVLLHLENRPVMFANNLSKHQILRFWVDDVLCIYRQNRRPNIPKERFSRPGRCDAIE